MKRKILIGLLIVIVIGVIIGYRMYSKTTRDLVDSEPDISISARNLLAAFEQDTASARRTYVDKVIAVTGTVKSIDTSGTIILGNPDQQSSLVFGLDRRHLKDHEQVKVGSEATLQGKCVGYEKGEEMLGVSLGTNVQFNFAGVKNKK
jgi:uncharacterized protein YneF (UPF0154 family)